jgi:hypothetical protein
MAPVFVLLLLLLVPGCLAQDPNPRLPEQLMLALSGVENELVFSWVTWAPTKSTNVTYMDAQGGTTWTTVSGTSLVFVDDYNYNITRYIHTVLVKDLAPSTLYIYKAGSAIEGIWSEPFVTKTIPSGQEVINMVVYGDLGLVNHQSLSSIMIEVNSGSVDLILHNGDYAYDLFDNNGTVGDDWMELMQPISRTLPYMGSVGNHEMKYNGSHYTNRFALYNYAGKNSGSNTNWWYSWDFISGGAKVHMTAISTEIYYIYEDNYNPPDLSEQVKAQWEWLEKDLALARNNSDWVIVYGHRPLYCSNVDDFPDCGSEAQVLRDGDNIPFVDAPDRTYSMDEMLGLNKVDIYIGAHEHSYERLFPVFRDQIDFQDNHTYVNPKYPVHLVLGAAGNQEDLDYFDEVFWGRWSAARSASYGYGHLRVHNKSHLYFDQLLAEGDQGKDEFWIVKDNTR